MMVYTYSRGDIVMDYSFKFRCLVFNEYPLKIAFETYNTSLFHNNPLVCSSILSSLGIPLKTSSPILFFNL